MKKIIVLFYCRICVDILGFPIYLEHKKTVFTEKKQSIIDDYNFSKKSNVLLEQRLIKQY